MFYDIVRPSLLWTLLPLLFFGLVKDDDTPPDDTPPDDKPPDDKPPDDKPPSTASWRDNLEDDIKGNPVFTKYPSQHEANKALVEAQDLIGKKGLIPPDENSSKEDIDNFYKELGRPEKAEDYTLPEVEGLPKDMPVDETLVSGFKTWAHKAGLSQKQVGLVYEEYQKAMGAVFTGIEEADKKAYNDAETNLRRDWGKSYPEKKAVVDKLIKLADTTELPFFAKHGNDPRLISFFSKVGAMMGEDKLAGIPKTLTMTPDEAKAEITRIKLDPKHPFNIEDHPERKMAQQHMDNLYIMAHPELAVETKK